MAERSARGARRWPSENAAPMQKSTRPRLLELIVARLGRYQVAIRLAVPLAILDDWSSGSATIPDAKLIALVNLIDETSKLEK